MTRFFLSFLLIIAATQLTAQDATPETAAAPIVVVEDAPSDAAIANRLRAILGALEQEDIAVTVEAGVVTLSGDIADPAVSRQVEGVAERLEGVVAVNNTLATSGDIAQQINPAFDRFRARIDQLISRLPLFLLALVAFSVILTAGLLLARQAFWDRISPNAFIAGLYRQAFRVASGIVGIVVALDVMGAAALLGTILGAAGIIGLAIGFAVRDTVENFVASIMLSLRQPFRPNDLVEIEGDVGRVIRLTSRATILLSLDGNHIRIPNATVFKSTVINYTRNPERRFDFDIGVGYGTDLAAAKLLAEETVKGLPFVLTTPSVSSWTTELGGSDVGMKVTGWIDQRETGLLAARSEAIRQVLIAFEEAGIEMPEPTYRLLMNEAGNEEPAPAPAKPNVAEVSHDVMNVEATTEHELEDIVDAERDTERQDLLRQDATKE